LTFTVGVVFTVTVDVLIFLQPLVVPVTVYTVVETGVTFIALVDAPVFHEYVLAPLAVRVAVVPEHMVDEFTFTVGVAFTLTVAVLAFWQPVVVPVTV
jgi:hypothetical protein